MLEIVPKRCSRYRTRGYSDEHEVGLQCQNVDKSDVPLDKLSNEWRSTIQGVEHEASDHILGAHL